MSSSFQTAFQDAVSVLYGVFGETAYHCDKDAVFLENLRIEDLPSFCTAITVRMVYGDGDEMEGADNHGVRAKANILVTSVDDIVGLTEINHGEKLIVGSDIWMVMDVQKATSGLEWEVGLSRYSRL